MAMAAISLIFLVSAIVLGFVKKINVGTVSFGLALILALIGGVDTSVIFSGFPSKLFITLLGTMFFFCLLQDNGTLELLSRKMIALVGKRTALIPIIIYLASFGLSAAGPGAISVQSVMIIFAVSLSVQMNTSPILMSCMAILGAVGGTASPIALSGIIVSDLTTEMGMTGVASSVFIGVSLGNLICAIVLYIVFKGYKLKSETEMKASDLPAFNGQQKLSLAAIVVLIVTVVGFQFDVGLISFSLALILILCKAGNEKVALKLVPWSVLMLICGVSVLMAVTKELGGIDLLSDILASLMNRYTASPLIALTAGLMSWFSSANGVVLPTLIPTVTGIVEEIGGNVTEVEMIIAIVAGATVAGISPLSTGGSLVLASYTQETNASEKEQSALFAKLFGISFGCVMVMVVLAFVGVFKFF